MDYFSEFLQIIEKLRGPDGCPWDKEQTAYSLRSNLLEEAYECIDAINSGDNDHMNEELGDLFLLATMISHIKEQDEAFTVKSVIDNVKEKLIRRHPHVFGDNKVKTSDEVITQWDRIKIEVEGKKDAHSILNTIPKSLPPLEKAFRLQKKAAKVGFDWKERDSVWDKVREEISEIEELGITPSHEVIEAELGDLFFAVVNLSRHYGVDPAIALHRTNGKFKNRFNYIEKTMDTENKEMSSIEFKRMDELWEESKSADK